MEVHEESENVAADLGEDAAAQNLQGAALQQTVNGQPTDYTLDINGGLPNVLSDGTSSYTFGLGNLLQSHGAQTDYFLGDALGSTRQLVDDAAQVGLAQGFEPFGAPAYAAGDSSSIFGYTGQQTDASGLQYLRARYYDPSTDRFDTRDTFAGYAELPQSLNQYAYALGNPVRYTDPGGQCIFFGVDTAACIIALAIGIPVVEGVTTAAWNYAVNQGGGLGGANWGHPNCIDWGQVGNAGGAGAIAAIEKLLAIPLGPVYLFSALMGHSPSEANAVLLSYLGLQDQYLALQGNPYYLAGGRGGEAGATYISLGLFLKGLPTIKFTPIPQISGYGELALAGYNVSVVGGEGALVYSGISGLTSQTLMMSAPEDGGDAGRGFAVGEHRHIKRIRATNVNEYMKKHEWALTEPATGSRVRETQTVIYRLQENVDYLVKLKPRLNAAAALEADAAIAEGNSKIAQLQAWLSQNPNLR